MPEQHIDIIITGFLAANLSYPIALTITTVLLPMDNKYKKSFPLTTNILYFLFISTVLFLAACTKNNYSFLPAYHFKSINKKPDYSNLNYWAAHPWKKDPGDSVPKPLLQNYSKDSLADVFFIHPTTLTSMRDSCWNADIDDADLNAKTDYSTILYQASVFNEKCRIFAPRYRQAHIRSFFVPDSISS